MSDSKRFLVPTIGAIAVVALIAAVLVQRSMNEGDLSKDLIANPPTHAEIDMAEMMGISVTELRHQTPEEHMQMMQDMMKGGGRMNHMHADADNPQPYEGIDIDSLPEASATEILSVKDGDTIDLNPTIVRKTVGEKTFVMYGYNGQIPGPIIVAPQAAKITVNVTNNINADTTVHWHGLRTDNAYDGVPDLTQEPIQPQQNYTYEVSLPDEGVFWYHPHIREDIQQDMGLYGNIVVQPLVADAYSPVNTTETVVLDDLLLDGENRAAYGKDGAAYALMGRFGNLMLVNGAPAKDYAVSTKKGSVVRFSITNVANTRTFRWMIPGAKMKLVASDIGRYERESWTDSVTIAPAERYTVDVFFPESGTYPIMHTSPVAEYALGTVAVSDEAIDESYAAEFETLHEFADVQKDIDAFRPHFDDPVAKTMRLTIEMHGMNHGGMMMHGHENGDGIEWEDGMPQMNAMMANDQLKWQLVDEETGLKNMDMHWKFKKGDIVKMRIINDEKSMHPMHHPIHFHGQRFLVLSRNGEENTNLVWKDTVLIPKGEYVDLLFDMSNPGKWMFHCHIAEHLTNGMMGMLVVE